MNRDDYQFLSNRWSGLKTISQLNGSRHRYRGTVVDVVDIKTSRKIGRMSLGAVLRKFN